MYIVMKNSHLSVFYFYFLGRNLDDVIYTLIKNFGEGSDYFKVIISLI
jgi:hypothetical protein